MVQRLLITGGSGLLGANFIASAVEQYDTYGVYHANPVQIQGCNIVQGDLTQQSFVNCLLNDTGPDIIVHCAALTDVDYCEGDEIKAWQVNVGITEHLLRWATENGSKLVYISTDSVFDGQRGSYCEDDFTNPLNIYAKTKLAAETMIGQRCPNHLIVRSNIYGWNIQQKLSLAEWILETLRHGQNVNGFRDVFFNPLLVNDLANVLLDMLKQELTGIFHVGSSQRINKADFAREIAREFGLKVDLVRDVSIEDMSFRAPRPKDTTLNVAKAEAALHYEMPGIREGLKRMRELLESGFVDSLKVGAVGSHDSRTTKEANR